MGHRAAGSPVVDGAGEERCAVRPNCRRCGGGTLHQRRHRERCERGVHLRHPAGRTLVLRRLAAHRPHRVGAAWHRPRGDLRRPRCGHRHRRQRSELVAGVGARGALPRCVARYRHVRDHVRQHRESARPQPVRVGRAVRTARHLPRVGAAQRNARRGNRECSDTPTHLGR